MDVQGLDVQGLDIKAWTFKADRNGADFLFTRIDTP
jgi:hypothetical protein